MGKAKQRRVTMEDVARVAGVSAATVSYAVRGKPGVSDASRARILDIAAKLGYHPNDIAARLARPSSGAVGAFLLDIHNQVFADMYDGMRSSVDQAGRELVVTIGSVAQGDREQRGLDQLVRSQVEVAIACCLVLPDEDLVKYESWMRIVSVGRLVTGLDSVAGDDAQGARLAVRHLIEQGHQKIAYVGPVGIWPRVRGYREAMEEAGLLTCIVETQDQSLSAAREAAESLLSRTDPPTAIFAFSDDFAITILAAARQRGISVPGELSVVGCDNTTAASAPLVDLTTVDLKPTYCGRRGAELALARLEDPSRPCVHELIEPSLIVRGSTGPMQ